MTGDTVSADRVRPSVDVGVCTYRRDSIHLTLRSLAAQEGLVGRSMRVIVADNDEAATLEGPITRAGRHLGLDLAYVHAPARNISVARNACIAEARGDWIAFIDDDETASAGWLSCLLEEAERGEWDVVLGPVRADYPLQAPAWMRDEDLHSILPVVRQGRIETGYSGNVLIRRAAIERTGIRFDPQFGRSGGEDVDFFYRLHDLGARIGFAAAAWVEEPVADKRANLPWLLVRAFRSGQTHGTRLARLNPRWRGRAAQAALAACKATVCGAAALVFLPRPGRRNRFVVRGVLHLGVLARLVGHREIQIY